MAAAKGGFFMEENLNQKKIIYIFTSAGVCFIKYMI